MRKLLVFPVFLALCVVNFDANAATARRGQTSTQSNNVTQSAAKTTPARAAAVRSAQRTPTTSNAKPNNSTSGTTRRSGTATDAKSTSGGVNASRAATQKVISGGTKVKTAAANTVIPTECQDAFYGCMDAFCMLENVSGGRCQCSDRNTELNNVLEEILKLDEQSYALATEGVERIQMGDNADLIMSRAKNAADKVAKETLAEKETAARKKRTLDLSLWNTNLFSDSDDEDEDIFSGMSQSEDTSFVNKRGDDLQSSAARLCGKQLTEQCKTHSSLLKSIYAQRVQSDCAAYENSLRQQKITSQQKLQTAQRGLREAALEMYQNENKYDLGQCAVQFKQCLQTTAECGTDFSGCVADVAILQALYNKSGSKGGSVATTSVKTGATSITISSATYDILTNKKKMCETVTKQCVNANKNDAVWKTVLKDIVPTVYTAEFSVASNNRMNCISTIVSCVQTYCGSKWDESSNNYDACLSDPDSVIKNACKLEAAKCGDSATSNNVMNYVRAKLAALRVDKCTLEVKECLTDEDRCGEDYSNCIGLDTDTIVDMCAEEKLIACSEKYNRDTVRDYIARVAQGIALNIDNSFAKTCQNAANAAMLKICGVNNNDEDEYEEETNGTCPGLILSNAEVKNALRWQYCEKNSAKCYDELSLIDDKDVKDNNIVPRLTGRLDMSRITFDKSGSGGATSGTDSDKYFYRKTGGSNRQAKDGYTDTNNAILESVIDGLNRDYLSVYDQILSDPTIDACLKGKSFQKITEKDGEKGQNIESTGRYTNLMNSTYDAIGNQMLSSVFANYNSELANMLGSTKKAEMYEAISNRVAQIIAREIAKGAGTKNFCDMSAEEFAKFLETPEYVEMMQQQQDEKNRQECLSYCDPDTKNCEPNFCTRMNSACEDGRSNAGLKTYKKTPSYDPDTNICTITVITYECDKTGSIRRNRNKCKRWNTSEDNVSYETQKMPEWYAPSQFEACQAAESGV